MNDPIKYDTQTRTLGEIYDYTNTGNLGSCNFDFVWDLGDLGLNRLTKDNNSMQFYIAGIIHGITNRWHHVDRGRKQHGTTWYVKTERKNKQVA